MKFYYRSAAVAQLLVHSSRKALGSHVQLLRPVNNFMIG